ncbi:MAG TPA: ATP-dependent DNA ligase [Acidimicrobiales bacterium]|nr:ATP-dependent DNA ligase [Acidimicrobiales bacterium]
MLLAEVVATSQLVAGTPARGAKIAALAALFSRLDADEVEIVVAALAGEPRQGKVGVGWATVAATADTVAPAAGPTLRVGDVDRTFTELQAVSGAGSGAARAAILTDLFARATGEEASFLRRLLTGELRHGALEGVVADAVARAAAVPPDRLRRAVMLGGNLARVAALALHDGADGLAAVGLELLRPVQPMLAATASSVEEAFAGGGGFSVEWKLDGARIQAHRSGEAIRLFTRSLNDVTTRLPAVAAMVGAMPGTRFVLDGEVVGTGQGERPEMFQDTMSRFSAGGPDLAVWWFDCLHLDGIDLLDRPWTERRHALERLAEDRSVPMVVTDEAQVGQAFLDAAVAAGQEGVVVKAVDSTYEAGRRGQAWKKVKPVRTFDLIVLAAEWGHGRRRGWLSNLHLGARSPDGGAVMVGKTFKGMTDDLLRWQTDRLLALETGRDGIVVHVRPELVVEVVVDGVQVSPRYPGGVALRFARIRRYRTDKNADEADVITDLRAMLPHHEAAPPLAP